jgi:hypothetical protein
MMLEIFTIFIPCWQVIRHRSLRQETLEAIAAWESKNKIGGGKHAASILSGSTKYSTAKTDTFKSLSSVERAASTDGSQYEGILTMDALESVLERNPEPLRKFSALRDFSGENIAFLTSVAEWKASLHPSGRRGSLEKVDENAVDAHELVRERFNRALRIYVDYISPRDAEFCINIACSDLKRIEAVFERAARILYGDKDAVNPIAPFEGFEGGPEPSTPSSSGSVEKPSEVDDIRDRVQYWGEIPEEFTAAIFDDAEASIKYLVLTNTWPKFVRERRYSMDSLDSDFTIESHASNTTLTRAVRYLRSVKSSLSMRSE